MSEYIVTTIGNATITALPPALPAPVVLPTVLTTLAFKRRLTATERTAMRTRAKTDPLVFDLLDLLDSAQHADLADADLNMGLQYAESKGDLGAGRANAILNAAVTEDEKP